MTGIAIVNFFGGSRPTTDWLTKFETVGSHFSPFIPVSNFPKEDWKGLTDDSSWIVRVNDSGSDQPAIKYLVRLDPDISDSDLRQALTYALAGRFDNLSENLTRKVYRGGDPATNGLFEGPALDLPWPQLGLGDLVDALKRLLSLNWVPWWAWAGAAVMMAVGAVSAKRIVPRVLFGSAGLYSGYRAFKKYRSDSTQMTKVV
ncbi:MAG: hypothetical protein K1X68_13595 [Saprospiraceae bacterium]|nr:hypothetical protein [Saprospiraceae bacterium]HMW39285.1 hypothetical protein [Saprospiraceae bacterium]HMX89081.1 hypothetical protein [Saprospiraceae bacterium]HMZ40952.1 hypothetical protein [Saprospiraceae bacterium]HNB30437.1 hypothetical protein [Saprospiraceae bacterium]